jgi:hypothetical protein
LEQDGSPNQLIPAAMGGSTDRAWATSACLSDLILGAGDAVQRGANSAGSTYPIIANIAAALRPRFRGPKASGIGPLNLTM